MHLKLSDPGCVQPGVLSSQQFPAGMCVCVMMGCTVITPKVWRHLLVGTLFLNIIWRNVFTVYKRRTVPSLEKVKFYQIKKCNTKIPVSG